MILPLEKQVCDLKYSQRLKELGIKQESLFYWKVPNISGIPVEVHSMPFLSQSEIREGYVDNYGFNEDISKNNKWKVSCEVYSAFTVAELGELLKNKYQIFTNYVEDEDDWVCVCKEWEVNGKFYTLNDESEANARAKMLIYLLENKL